MSRWKDLLMFPYLVLFLFLLDSSNACVHTSPISSPGTTLSPGVVVTTTTTAAPTTTTTALPCASCMATDVTFQPADPTMPGTIDSSFRVEPLDPATGCARLTAICTAQAGMAAFMEFNMGQGGPVENNQMTQVVEAALDCINGQWVYMMQRVVMSVNCHENPGGG